VLNAQVLSQRNLHKRTFGEKRALGESDPQVQAGGSLSMVNLNEVKVTPRDKQVLNLLVQGCSNKEIAGQLNISPRTVKQHLRTLFLRAGIREGRKRVKLAIAMCSREEAQS
jgi:DNA-binding NarL/FixJ family response regulator